MDLIEGYEFELVELETFVEKNMSRPRVRPLSPFPAEIKVEFPTALRVENPIGTRFRADVVVCQKHNKDGSLKGSKYLRSIKKTIVKVDDFTPQHMLMALRKSSSASGRVYEYVELVKENNGDEAGSDLQLLRRRAIALSSTNPTAKAVVANVRERKNIIKLYALARSRGGCEACGDPAPFIRKNNGEPYLEVHHIIEISKGGSDSPHNVAAVCPNCHARVTYGEDAVSYNGLLNAKIKLLEDQLTS